MKDLAITLSVIADTMHNLKESPLPTEEHERLVGAINAIVDAVKRAAKKA